MLLTKSNWFIIGPVATLLGIVSVYGWRVFYPEHRYLHYFIHRYY